VAGKLLRWDTVLGWDAGAADEEAGAARRLADVAVYREAVADVLAGLSGAAGSESAERAERVLERRLPEPEFTVLFAATPAGPDAAIQRILREVRAYQPSERSLAGNLVAMIRIALLTEIDLFWWGHLPSYLSDAEVLGSPELLDLEALRRDDRLLFRYRLQSSTLLGRAVRSAERRAAPERAPRTAGLLFPRARAELVVLLNQIAAEFAALAPAGTPRLWVTSLARSEDYQRHLRALGYAALLPSAHCVGYAADVEMAWFRRFRAEHVLQRVLLERQRAGDINVIDEGQAWHLCLRPGAGRALRLVPPRAG
jgi:hypothetical protein